MNPTLVQKILAAYGVEYTQILPAQKGYRNEAYPVELLDGQRINVLLYKIEPDILIRIKDANRVADFLAARGFPARSTYDPRILEIKAGGRRKYACLYRYLPGHTIPWEAYTQEHIKLLGGAMSNMHALLSLQPSAGLPHVADEYAAILGRMQAYFTQPGVQSALQRKLGLTFDVRHLADLKELLKAAKRLPGHPLHMDFVRGNILFDGAPAITGVLDFEKTALGHPSFDIARTLAFLLVDCKYKQGEKVRKYFLYSGYHKRGAAALPPIRLIDALMPLFLLHDFYKFLRHNPYEYLEQNEHYLRTRDVLLTRKMLEYGASD